MQYPKFYDEIETITLQDDLADFLGAFEQGIIEFSYLDVVKAAGHSCPTVLGAFLMTREGLKALYQDELAKRGEILVEFDQNENEGVAGVIANVIANITGAAVNRGFKGLAGKFDRRHLMQFESTIQGNVKFTRQDTHQSVEVVYDASSVPADANMSVLMQASLQGFASEEQKVEFSKLWQERVESIANNVEQVITIIN
jgi:FmdE protein associated with molybdenum formylmethanofuran dehydrogenase